MTSVIISVIIAVVTVVMPIYSPPNSTIAAELPGLSVIMPKSTHPTGKNIFSHSGVDEWFERRQQAVNPEPWKDSTECRVVFYSEYEHPGTGAYYTLAVTVFGPLYYIESEETAMKEEAFAEVFEMHESEMIRYYDTVDVNGNQGRSFCYESSNYEGGCVRGLTVLRGDTLFTVRALVPDKRDTATANKFIASLQLQPGPIASTIATPKGAAFLRFVRTLNGEQQATSLYAYRLFAEADLPALYEALHTPFADEQLPDTYSIRSNLLNNISRLDKTPDVGFLCNLYSEPGQSMDIRGSILLALGQSGTVEAVKGIARLLRDDVNAPYVRTMMIGTKERPELARYMLPCIPTVIDNPKWQLCTTEFLASTLANGYITADDLAPYSEHIARSTNRYLASYLAWRRTKRVQKAKGSYKPEDGIPALNIILASFLCDKHHITSTLQALAQDPAMSPYACASLLRCGNPVDASTLYQLAAEPLTRAPLYGAMKKTGTLAHFPEKFRSQRLVTESMIIIQHAQNGYVPKVEYIAEREYTDTVHNTLGGRFLYFKVLMPPSEVFISDYSEYGTDGNSTDVESEEISDNKVDDTPRWCIRLYGPYSPDSSGINANGDTGGMEITLPFDGNADEELFAKMFRYYLISNQPD